MLNTNLEKAQEIAFALIRLAGYVRRPSLRKFIENSAYQLIDDLSRQNFESAVLSIQAIRGFALLGKNLYEIEPKNYSLLENELEQLNTAIRQEYGIAESIDMRQFISTKLPIKKAQEKKEVVDSGEILVNENEIGNEFVTTEADYSMNERQDRIMSLIASQRKMQLRDFISAFPGVSERTLRYDLKRLFEQGRVVRQGSGGPGSFYVIKEN
jgi:hypothetical protein